MKNTSKSTHIFTIILSFLFLSLFLNSASAQDRVFRADDFKVYDYDKCSGLMKMRLLIGEKTGGSDNYHNGTKLYYRDLNNSEITLIKIGTDLNDPIHHTYKLEHEWQKFRDYTGSINFGDVSTPGNDYFIEFEWKVPSEMIGEQIHLFLDIDWRDGGSSSNNQNERFEIVKNAARISMPSNLKVSSTCDSTTITWENPTIGCGETGSLKTEIYKNDNLLSTIYSGTEYNDNNVTNGGSGSYKVRAIFVNEAGKENISTFTSNTQSSTPSLPSTPQNVVASQTICGKIKISWEQSQNQEFYTIKRQVGAGSFDVIDGNVPQYKTYFEDSDIANGTSYKYAINSRNECGESYFSNEATIISYANAADPTVFTASYSDFKVKLTWNISVDVLGYKIFRNGTEIADITGDNTEYYDNDISKCTDYEYTIQSYTACNQSSAIITSISIPGSSLNETTLTASDGKYPNRVELKWTKIDGISEYKIFRDEQLITSLPSPNTVSYLDYDVFPGEYNTYLIEGVSVCATVESVLAKDVGFILPNGKITGHIKTQSGNFVEGVEVKVEPTLGTSLTFDGQDDYIQIPDAEVLGVIDASFTAETWIKINDFDGNGSDRTILGAPKFKNLNDTAHIVVKAGSNASEISFKLVNSAGQEIIKSEKYTGGAGGSPVKVQVYLDNFAGRKSWQIKNASGIVVLEGKDYTGEKYDGQITYNIWCGSKPKEMYWTIRNETEGKSILSHEGYDQTVVDFKIHSQWNPKYIDGFDVYDSNNSTVLEFHNNNTYNPNQDLYDEEKWLQAGDYRVHVYRHIGENYNWQGWSDGWFSIGAPVNSGQIKPYNTQYANNGYDYYFTIPPRTNFQPYDWETTKNLKGGEYSFEARDYGGDGWNDGGYFEVITTGGGTSIPKTYPTGSSTKRYFTIPVTDNQSFVYDGTIDLPPGEYTFHTEDASGNWWGDSWFKIITDDGNELYKKYANNNASFSFTVPAVDNYTTVLDTIISIPSGTYSFIAEDSKGDGWNDNGTFEIDFINSTDIAPINPTAASLNTAFTVAGIAEGGLHYVIRNQKPLMSFYDDDLAGNTVLNTNEWTHIAFRYDKEKAEQAIFVNGKLDTSVVEKTPYLGTGNLFVGSWFGAHNFNGNMDEFRLWTYARTNEEINRDYQRTLNGTEEDLMLYYRFDENTGNIEYDMTTEDENYFHGSIIGATWSDEKAPVYTSGFTDESGNYVINKINYSGINGQTFNVIPFGEGRLFNPQNSSRTLDPNAKVIDGVDFTDLSTFPVSGTLKYLNTNCYVSNVQVLVDGQSTTPPAFTDENGYWSSDVQIGSHIFTVQTDTIDAQIDGISLNFDGEDDFIQINDNQNLHFSDAMTVCAWVYWSGEKNINTLFAKLGNNNEQDLYIAIDSITQKLNVKFEGSTNFTTSIRKIAANSWTHIAVTYEQNTNANCLNLYINGVADNADAGENTDLRLENNTNPLYVGYNPMSEYENFSGKLDEISFWNIALPKDSINSYLAKELTGDETGLVSYYKFNDIDKNYVSDSVSGVALNSGTIYGNAEWTEHGIFSVAANVFKYLPVNQNYNPLNNEYKMFVANPKLNLNFDNTTYREVSGSVHGGCNYSIGLSNVIIKSIPACFGDTIYNVTKDFKFDSLPPLSFIVEVLPHDITKTIPAQTISLNEQDTNLVFTYRAPLQALMRASNRALNVCEGYKVFNQWEKDTVYIEVFENYNGQKCYIDSATVIIYDDIAGNKNTPDTIYIKSGMNGVAKYFTVPAFPNISGNGDHPYQKKIEAFIVDADSRSTSSELWGMTLGTRPRPKTFTSRLPSIPFMILRDPPGDQSYAYWEKGTTHTNTLSFSKVYDSSLGIESTVSLGLDFSFSTGLGYEVETEIDVTLDKSETHTVTATLTSNKEIEISVTTNETITTEQDELYVGDNMDVFVGGALNIIYGTGDELIINNCQPKLQSSFYMNIDTMRTFFIYTAKHIKDRVIPDLIALKEDTLSRGFPEDIDTLAAEEYQADINAWEDMLANNTKQKEQAIFKKNISFSYGVSYEASETSDTTTTHSSSTELSVSNEYMYEAGFETNGIGSSLSTTLELNYETGKEKTESDENTTTIGYYLNDNDPGDFFSINVYQDKVYKTPVFKTLAGASMCPHETNTVPREGVQLSIEGLTSGTNTESDIAPEDVAAFRIGITNTSMTGEGSNLGLAVVQDANPNGAIIKINGIPVDEYVTFQPAANQTIYATVTVEKGPVEYDYDNLKLLLYSKCEYGLVEDGSSYSVLTTEDGTIINQTAETALFNVRFQKPCVEDFEILQPKENWVFNMSSKNLYNDTLHIFYTSRNFKTDLQNDNLEKVYFEWAIEGTNNPYPLLNAETNRIDIEALGESGNYAHIGGNIANLNDGEYKIRIASSCNNNTQSYSNWIKGSIFRSPPQVFGTPQPMDGVLSANDYISVSFDKNIDCEAIKPHNAWIMGQLSGTEYIPRSIFLDGIDDYIILNEDTTNKFYEFADTTDFTIEFWIKSSAAGWQGRPTIVTNKNWDSPYNKGFAVFGNTDKKSIGFNIADGTNLAELSSGDISDGNWHHIAITGRRPMNTNNVDDLAQVKLLVDLQVVDNASILDISDISSNLNLVLGQDASFNFENNFGGFIDELRMWNIERTRVEMLETWKKPLIGNEIGLVACWRFDKKGTTDKKVQEITGNFEQAIIVEAEWKEGEGNASPIDAEGIEEIIPVICTCNENTIIMVPNIIQKYVENANITAVVNQISDKYGNKTSRIEWELFIDQNAVRWEQEIFTLTKFEDSTLTIPVLLENTSAGDQPYWIENLPDWLSTSITEGNLKTYEGVIINFEIAEWLSTGEYTANVKAKTLNGWEPLQINVRVICSPPAIEENFSDFEYSLNIIASLEIDGEKSNDIYDLVRVYNNDILCGSGKVKYYDEVDDYLALITIYSNTTEQQSLDFQIWDASACSNYIDNQYSINFIDNDIIGTLDSAFIISTNEKIERTYNLESGWNWVSFNLNTAKVTSETPADMNINDLISGNFSNNDLIKNIDNYAYYNNAEWGGSLETVNNLSAYLLKTDKSVEMKTKGYIVPQNTAIPIAIGWNWISYLPNSYTEINTALASIQYTLETGDIIKNRDAFAQYYKGNGWVGDLEFLSPGNGYMIYLNNVADTIVYKQSIEQIINEPTQNSDLFVETVKTKYQNYENYVDENTPWEINASDYKYNMNITAKLNIDSIPYNNSTAILAAFKNNECIGIAKPVQLNNEWLYFLTVYGNDATFDVNFKMWNPESLVLINETTIVFNSNKTLGTPENPQYLNFSFDTDNAPLFSLIPDFIINEGETFAPINIYDYLTELDGNEIVFSLENHSKLDIEIEHNHLSINNMDENWTGEAQIIVSAKDKNTFHSYNTNATINFKVNPIDDYPEIRPIPTQQINKNEFFNVINLNDYLQEYDNDEIIWKIDGTNNLDAEIQMHNLLKVIPKDGNWYGKEEIILTATDNTKLKLSNKVNVSYIILPGITDNPQLLQNEPNPFGEQTLIKYIINEETNVTIDIYNSFGQKIKDLVNTNNKTGVYQVIWDGTDNNNNPITSGVYFYILRTNNFSSSKAMIINR